MNTKMRKIGVLSADKMGGLSQSFCIQRMREAKIDSTIVMSKYFSNSARSDFKVSGLESLLRLTDRLSDDDVMIFSRLSKAYLPMSREASASPPGRREARRFTLHLQSVSEPLSRKVIDAAMNGANVMVTVGGFRDAMAANETVTDNDFEYEPPPRPSIGILLAEKLSVQTIGRCVDEFRQSGIDDVIVYDPSGRSPGTVRNLNILSSRIVAGQETDSNDGGADSRVVLCVTEAERVSDACASLSVRRGRFQLFGRDGETKVVPAFRFNPSEIQKYGSFAAYAGDLLKALRLSSGMTVFDTMPDTETTNDDKKRVVIGMASYQERESGMLSVVRSLATQCDEMRISLNGYSGERLRSVLEKLKNYGNVVATSYVGDEDLGCQNKFRGLSSCGDGDYFLTVDDDLIYPHDYVKELVSAIDRFGGTSFVSFHGSILSRKLDGGLRKNVVWFGADHTSDVMVHMAGTGVGGCVPSRIGLKFDVFSAPRNTGDDELMAIWARDNGVRLTVAKHRGDWIRVNKEVEKTGSMWRSDNSMSSRLKMLDDSGPWPDFSAGRVFFRIVVPVYGSKTLERALNSIAAQTFESYIVSVCDDRSPKNEAEINRKTVASVLGAKGVFTENKGGKFAGAARNSALDAPIDSEYTLFLDADDVFTYSNLFSDLHDFIESHGRPDVVVLPFFHHTGRSTVNEASNVRSPKSLAEWRYVAPWTKCIRSALCPKFQENARRSNDVLQHLRTADCVSTVVPFGKEAVRYMKDGETTMYGYAMVKNTKSADSIGSILVVAGSVLMEEWKHDYMRTAVARHVRGGAERLYTSAIRSLGSPLEKYVKVSGK